MTSPSVPAKLRLYGTVNSPFTHKVLVTAHELGLRDRMELILGDTQAFGASLPADLIAANPLGKVGVHASTEYILKIPSL